MRLVSFRHADTSKFGVFVDGGIVDLSARWPSLRDAIAAKGLADVAAATRNAAADFSLDEVELLPVIPEPGQDPLHRPQLCEPCRRGRPRSFPPCPASSRACTTRWCRTAATSSGPRASTNFDFEGELAIVIGERCRHVPRASALSVIAGYTCFLDVSVRDFQKHSVTAGKNFPAPARSAPGWSRPTSSPIRRRCRW